MCGIVGYVGDEEAAPILLHGLAKLEYRGYEVNIITQATRKMAYLRPFIPIHRL